MRNSPDGLLGAVVASESVGFTDTMVNGAGGCRSRAQTMLHELLPDYEPESPERCASKYFSGQSRLPCTFVNNDDVVFGTGPKVSEGVSAVSECTGRGAVLVDTLGASLLCTDYSGLTGGLGRDPILVDGDLASMSFAEGFDAVVSKVLESAAGEGGPEKVNVLGYGIQDPGWGAGRAEIARLLSLMGLEARFPCCRPGPDDVRQCGSSRLNVMLRPEFSRVTAETLGRMFGTPSLRPSAGAPVGYDATRSFVAEVADATGADPAAALAYVDAEAEAVHRVLMNHDRAAQGLHAKGVAVEADSSTALPLLRWLHGRFGMAPRSVVLRDPEYSEETSRFLEGIGYADAMGAPRGDSEFVFTDGISALEGRMDRSTVSYVEVCMPRGRHLDLVGRCVVGTAGCRYLLDEALNGALRFRCGQPTEVEYRPRRMFSPLTNPTSHFVSDRPFRSRGRTPRWCRHPLGQDFPYGGPCRDHRRDVRGRGQPDSSNAGIRPV